MNIISAIRDRNLFQPFLQDRKGSIDTWQNWLVALKALYGLRIASPQSVELVKTCTGREVSSLPSDGFTTALFLTGRRSGKSRMSAIVGAYEAVLSGREKMLSKGEMGLVSIISPTRKQSRIVKGYLRSIFDQTDLLRQEVVKETQEGFELANGVLVEILVGDWRSVRGYSLLACICDELAFMGLDEECKVRSDTELVRAVLPSLATTGGKLIGISSPYARKGYCWQTYQKHFGNDSGKVLVWNCGSRVMNPTLSQGIVDQALQEDLAAAKSEFLGEFRDDIALWLGREAIEPCIVPNRKELIARPNVQYTAFVDVSGGRNDDAALAISHRDAGKSKSVLDFAKRWKPPFSPQVVVADMVDILHDYGCVFVLGDAYGAEWVSESFRKLNISYRKADKNKSQIYLELLPRICSGEIELLDDPLLISQLAGLERRTRSGGKDIVDHSPGAKDDLANACAGSLVNASKGRFEFGFLRRDDLHGGKSSGSALRNRIAMGRLAQMQRGRR